MSSSQSKPDRNLNTIPCVCVCVLCVCVCSVCVCVLCVCVFCVCVCVCVCVWKIIILQTLAASWLAVSCIGAAMLPERRRHVCGPPLPPVVVLSMHHVTVAT